MENPEIPFIGAYLLIASVMANLTILFGYLLSKDLINKIWFGFIIVILSFVIPYIIIKIEINFGSIRAFILTFLDYSLHDKGQMHDHLVDLLLSDYFYQLRIILRIIIADAAGILAGFCIWYYVRKKLTAASE